jgi:hypothetical protein
VLGDGLSRWADIVPGGSLVHSSNSVWPSRSVSVSRMDRWRVNKRKKPRMRIHVTSVYVDDQDKALSFYTDLRLPHSDRRGGP